MFLCNIGVRQDKNLLPLQFAIFVRELEKFMSQSVNG